MSYGIAPPPDEHKNLLADRKTFDGRPVSALDANPTGRQCARILVVSVSLGLFGFVLPAVVSGFVIGFVNDTSSVGGPLPDTNTLILWGVVTGAVAVYLSIKTQLGTIARDQRDAENTKLSFGRDGRVPEKRVTRYLK